MKSAKTPSPLPPKLKRDTSDLEHLYVGNRQLAFKEKENGIQRETQKEIHDVEALEEPKVEKPEQIQPTKELILVKRSHRVKRMFKARYDCNGLCKCCCGLNLERQLDFWLFRYCHFWKTAPPPLIVELPIKCVDNLFKEDGIFAFPLIQDEFIEFIIHKLFDEVLYGQEVTIILHSLDPKDKRKEQRVRIALLNSFRHYAEMASYELNETMTEGIFAIIISAIILLIVFVVIIPLNVYVPDSANNVWYGLLFDFLIVFLWVAIWHPFEQLIYGRYMVRFKRDICRALGTARVSVLPLEKDFIKDGIDFKFEEIELEQNNEV